MKTSVGVKAPAVENLLEALAPHGRMDNCCAFCGSCAVHRDDFRDGISLQEFKISKMCQVCQDRIFGE